MSVTLYTTRAKRQFKALAYKMDDVERALTVFNRDAVYIKNV